MVYGDFCTEPVELLISKRLISYWCKLTLSHPKNKIAAFILQYITKQNKTSSNNIWLSHIKNILCNCGLPDVFDNPQLYLNLWIISNVESILKDQFFQSRSSDMQNSSKGTYYQVLKRSPKFEQYLLLPNDISKPILKFIKCNHKLPIETVDGREFLKN